MSIKQLMPVSLKKRIKRLLETDLIRSLVFDFNYFVLHREPIMLVQMGKVGSRSIEQSLSAYGVWIHHAHSLNDQRLEAARQINKAKYTGGVRHWIWMSRHIVQRRNAARKYITLVRDPVAVQVAGFFENLDRFLDQPNAYQQYDLDELLTYYHERTNYDYVLEWFDQSLKVVPGIDVFAYAFPKEQGYGVIKQDNIELLIIKTETDDAVKETCIAEFLGLRDFKLSRANVGEEKGYADLYRAFKQAIQIPANDLETCYSAKYTRHFYTVEEIKRIQAQWSERRSHA